MSNQSPTVSVSHSPSISLETCISRRLRPGKKPTTRALAWIQGAVCLGLVMAAALGQQAQAQYTLAPSWTQQSPANSPSARYIHALAYDATNGQVVLFGGFGGGYLNDTWLWNGTNWTQVSPASSPSPRAAHAMAYDSTHGQVILFGGLASASTRLGDTWLWNGTNWTQLSPAASPSARDGAVLVDYPGVGLLLFGGTNGSDLNDTWLWDGTNWTQATSGNNPSARADYGMAYDPGGLGVTAGPVLFGGSVSGTYENDTYLWNSQLWFEYDTPSTPPARYAPGMVFDAALGHAVMFGGYNGSLLNDTWSFDSASEAWQQFNLPTSPSGRSSPNGMAYDSLHQQIVLFGGSGSTTFNDTWTFGLPGNFGNVNVCPAGTTTPAPCSSTAAFTYNVSSSTTFGTPTVVTQGTSGLDFTLASSTCTGTVAPGTCTVNVTFAPLAPGVRMGAVNLVDNTGAVLATTLISGVGQGSAAAIGPGTQSVVPVTGLHYNVGVAVDAAGNTFVADYVAGKVVKYTPGGVQTTVPATGLSSPIGVAVDGAGDVYIVDQSLANVVEVTPSGVQTTLGSELSNPISIALDAAGDVFVGDQNNNQVEEITPGGVQTTVPFTGLNQPWGVAVDALGDVFVADGGNSRVEEITPIGVQTTVPATGLSQPYDLAVDAAGSVYIADPLNARVVEVPAGSGPQTNVGTGLNYPSGLTVDGAGNVVIGDQGLGQVFKVNRSQPSSLSFAATNVGSTSSDSPKSVGLQNVGNQPLDAIGLGLEVEGAGFAQVPGSGTPADCSASFALTPGQSCNLSLSFTAQSGGGVGGTAAFVDNALNSPSAVQAFGLNGFGVGQYTIGGTISGLVGGLVLQDNLGDNLSVASNGSFAFVTSLATGSPYSVTVLTQPTGQACTVINGSGTVASANITNVQVSCANVLNYPLTVTEAGTGAGTVTDNLEQISCIGGTGTCAGSYPSGTLVTLTASASGTSIFAGWGGACSSSGASGSCIVTMTSALSVSASFIAPGASQSGTLKPITAGVVYGQGGSFTSGAANNGGVSANSLSLSQGLVFDGSGNLYVSDGNNNRVLFYPAGSTTATRVYGQNGSLTSNASNNGGTSANSLSNPQGLALDSVGNLYVADESNSRVLFYPAGSTTATRVYGQPNFTTGTTNTGGITANSLFNPIGIALDSGGNLYVADYGNSRVVFYPSGSTTANRVYGQGGSFTSNTPNNGGISANSLNQSPAVALDASGDLYVADLYNNRVLFYPANSTTATRVYGQGGTFNTANPNDVGITPTGLYGPFALTVDSNGGLYVVDRSNNRVLYYPFGGTTATLVYGQSGSFTSSAQNNGGVSANSLNQPWAVALDKNGNVYIADYGNNRVLEYGSFGNINACPAGQSTPAPCNRTVTYSYSPAISTLIGATQVVTQGVTGLDFTLGSGNTCTGGIGADTSCTVNVNFTPLAPGLRSGAIELFDNTGNPLASAPIYGTGQGPEIAFATGVQSPVNAGTLSRPAGVLADAVGNLFISDTNLKQVQKIAPNGTLTTVGSGFQFPQGMAEDGAGNLYVADNNLNQVIEIPAGCTSSACQQVLGGNLRSQLGVAVDGSGNLFIDDFLDGEVVKSPAGCTTTNCQTIVYGPTAGSNPVAMTTDSAGSLYIADFGLKAIMKVPSGCTNSSCVVAIGSGWNQPDGVAVDAAGDVFVADAGLQQVVEVPAGCTNAGCQVVLVSGINTVALAVDTTGSLYISDLANARVFKLNRSLIPSISFATTNVGSTSSDSPVSFTVQNVGNLPLTGSLAFNLGSNFTQNSGTDCSTQFPIAPGVVCSESFSFTPQSATFLSGTATFADNTLNSLPSATQIINLSGIGATNGTPGTVAVPNVVGQTQAAAATPIAGVGLTTGTVSTASSQTIPTGSIISENPVAGTQVAVGSVVNLLVSSGLPQAPSPNPLSLENNYFLTGDYVSAGVTLRGTGVGGMATGTINIPTYTQSATQGVPTGADIVDAFLYWETVENTAFASSTVGTFNGYSIVGQQIGNDIPNYTDGAVTGTLRAYRASVNIYLPVGANGIRPVSGAYKVSLPDAGGSTYPLTEGASLVFVYRVLSPNFPLKSVIIYDGAGLPAAGATQVVQGFYDAVGGANGSGKNTNLFASAGSWNNSVNTVTLGQSNQYSAPLNPSAAYAAVILSTPVNNSDNDGILDAWKTGPPAGDFHVGQPGYYDVKTSSWVGLPGARHGQKDLFVQLDYMCGAVLSSGSCDPTQENLFPSPDANGNDPLAMVQQAFAQTGVQLHLQIGNAVPENTCVDGSSSQLCQFPNQPGVVGWKNSLEFSKLYPRNLASCLSGGDCTTRFPYGQKDSYHYVLMGHSLAIPAYNTRYGTLTSINVVNGVTTIVTADRGTGISACPGRITISGVLGNPGLNGVYNTTGCADTKTITVATPGVTNWSYPNNTLPEPVIGLTSGTITSISGYSDLGGADSAVTLGLWLTAPNQDMSKRANVIAGTLFHEIGHTLGLSHGGLYYDTPNSYVPTFEANCKPNYQSIMNYLFQLDGVGPNQSVAFSNQTLNTLNENAAGSVTQLTDTSNNPATFSTSAWYVPYTTGSLASPATRHCDGTALIGDSAYRVDAPIAPITPPWTNGQDLNFIGVLQTQERGYNDFANIDLRQVGATGGEFASLASVLSFGSSVAPLNISAGGNVALGSGGTIALGSGGNVTLGSGGNVTLGSGGTITLGSGGNVTLGSGGNVTLGSGGTVTPGSNGLVTLAGGGNVTLGSGGTITLGSGGNVTLGSGGNVTLGSGGTITLGSGGTVVTIPSTGGSYSIDSNGGTIALGSGGNVTLGSGGNVTLGSGGTIALGSGGNVTLGSGGNVTLGSGGNITLGSGGNVTLGSGGNVTLGSGGNITLGSGGNITLGSGGNVTLGSGGTVTLGSGGNVALGSGGNVTLGSGGTATLGAGGTVTLGSGGNVTLGSGGNVTLGSGGNIALGSGGNVTLGSGGNVTLGSGGNITLGSGGTITLGSGGNVTLGSGGTVTLSSGGVPIVVAAGGNITLGSGGTVTLGSGGNVTLGSGGNVTLGSGGVIAFASGGNVTLGSGGNVTLGSGGNITLGSGGTITLGSGGNVTLGSGGVVTLGNGGSVTMGSGSDISLGSVSNNTTGSGGPLANELTYETANSVVRVPTSPTETSTPAGVRITWKAPAFGVVQTYTIYRSSNGATPIVIGSVSGVNGNPPATEFTDTNPDLTSKTVVYTITTTLVPDAGTTTKRSSQQSAPAVLKNDQTITLGPLPSSVLITNPPTITATAMSAGVPNGLQVVFSATGSCSIGSQSIATNVSSATIALNTTGSCTVSASQPGTTAFNAANAVSGTFMVLPQGSTTQSQTINFATLPNVQYGGKFSLSATSSASLPVSFTASGPCTTSGITHAIGVCSITASAPASGGYSAASLTQSFTIYPAVLKVTANSLTTAYGQPVPSLTYQYSGFVGSDTAVAVVSGAPALSTTATATSNVGSYPITVSTGTLATMNYSFLYVNGTLTVQPANQAALLLKTTSPLVFNQSETLSAAGGTTNGTISYNLVSGLCGLVGAKLTANSGTGSCLVTATMAGNNNYNPVTSTPVNTVTLAQASQAITFTTNPPATAAYNSTFTVAATASSGVAVTFTSAGACSNSGATYTMTNSIGTCSVIASQAGNTNYAPAMPVTKTVTAAGPLLSLSTSNINFGTLYVGGISAQTITLTNIGNAPVTINDPILSIVKGGNSNEFVALSLCPRPLAAGKSCTVAIAFFAGPFYTPQTATLQIMSNAPGSPQPVALSATVINPIASFSPSSLNFGTVKHATSSTLNVVLSNPGSTPLSLTGVSIAGANAAYFAQTNTCKSSLAAGASCSVAVKFTPAATGTFSASLVVVDNAQSGGGTQIVPLSGKGN